MSTNVELQIVKLRNELRARKQASELSWGQLSQPDLAPSQTFSGYIDVSHPISTGNNAIVCKFKARFKRTDEIDGAPLVQFAYEYSVNPTGVEIERAHGGTISIDNDEILYQSGCEALVTEAGDDYVDFDIRFPDNGYLMSYLYYQNYGVTNVKLDLTVTAISPVKGLLTLERVYE